MLLQGPSGNFTVLLDERPVVTFSGDDFVVTTHMGALSLPASQVTKFTYVNDEQATGIGDAARFGSLLSFDGKQLRLSRLSPSSAGRRRAPCLCQGRQPRQPLPLAARCGRCSVSCEDSHRNLQNP